LRILHLYKDYYPVLGGIENHIKVLAEAQAAAGHQVAVLVCDPGPRTCVEELNGVKVIKAGRLATAASMPLSLSQPVIAARLRPDMVHVHSPYPLGEVSAWLLKRRVPLVITHHSDVVRQQRLLRFYGPILRRVLRAAKRIIATSPRYIESSPWLRPHRTKCTVVPLGVDVGRFHPAERTAVGPLRLAFVGRLRYYKGLDTLLHALTLVPEAELVVVGSGPMREDWERLVSSLGLGGRVTFAGEVDDEDLPGWYQRADAFVLPANARAEAFGTVLVEAMACGLPCITTEVGSGTSWVVQDGQTGLVVPPLDPPALAGAIRKLHDADLRARMGRAGYERVQALLTEAQMVQQVMAVYWELLPGQSVEAGSTE
jgi:rhamnosyl/mannosyltransferase